MTKKTYDFGEVGEIYSAQETIYPSEKVTQIATRKFPRTDLNLLYRDLNYVIQTTRKKQFESELKSNLGNMDRLSYKFFKKKLRPTDMKNGALFFEDHGIDIFSKDYRKSKEKIKKNILAIKSIKCIGRPSDEVLKNIINEVDHYLFTYESKKLSDYVTNKGLAKATEAQYHGIGIEIISLILKDFKVKFYSSRTIFDIIKPN